MAERKRERVRGQLAESGKTLLLVKRGSLFCTCVDKIFINNYYSTCFGLKYQLIMVCKLDRREIALDVSDVLSPHFSSRIFLCVSLSTLAPSLFLSLSLSLSQSRSGVTLPRNKHDPKNNRERESERRGGRMNQWELSDGRKTAVVPKKGGTREKVSHL